MTVALSRNVPQALSARLSSTLPSYLWLATLPVSLLLLCILRPSFCMSHKSGRKRTRLDYLIPEGQVRDSQQFYISLSDAHRNAATASVIPPRPWSNALCDTVISDDRRRIYRTPIALQPTGKMPLFDNILHPDLGEDILDPATLASSVPADYFNSQDSVPEDLQAIIHAVDNATRELEISVRAFVTYVS